MFAAVTGLIGGKNNTTLIKQTQAIATMLIGSPHFPRVKGPSMNLTLFL